MKHIGLLSNLDGNRISSLVKEIAEWLKKRNINLLLDDECAGRTGHQVDSCSRNELVNRVDCLMVLGGDGTLLNSARLAAPCEVPIFGINMGRLGFLTEVDVPQLFNALGRLIEGKYYIEERMMLEACVLREGNLSSPLTGLNDAVITKGAFARLIKMDTMVDGRHFNTYHADGVIIATPTGSTAYSLSAGGPLVVPDLELLLFTPICPHALWARPLVISPQSEVLVTLRSRQGEVMLTVDGQLGMHLKYGDTVRVKKSRCRAKFIKLNNQTFFDILREKFKEGDGVNG